MRFFIYSILIFTLVSFSTFPVFAQWQLQNSGVTDDLQAVSMVSGDVGYAAGAFGLILKTSDGGLIWDDISSSAFTGYASDIKFVSPDTGYIHGWGQIYKTYNGGASWSQVYTAPSWHYFCMDFWDEDHFTIAGRIQVNQNNYWSTKSGSSGWHGGVYPGSDASSQFHDMQYLSADKVMALRFNGICYSDDGGDTWEYISNDNQISQNAGWNEFQFVNEDIGYVGGTNYSNDSGILYKTTNGGQSYTVAGNFAGGIRAVHFINENLGFVGCEGGYIYKTEDGGQSWFGEQHGVSTIKDIDFVDEQIGIFVTETGAIYTTTNGGNLIPYDRDAVLLDVELHNVLNLEAAPYSINTIVRNQGLEDLNTLDLNYQIDGGTVQTMNLTNLNLGNLISGEYTHSTPWNPTLGEHEVKIWISSPNGQSDQNTNNDTTTLIVTVFASPLHNRNVLAEDATGAWCGYCPGAAITFDTLSSWYNTDDEHRFIAVGQHNGDWMESVASDTYASLWSEGAFPSYWFDRFRYFGKNVVKMTFDDDVVERLDQRLAMDAPVEIGIGLNYNETTREVTVDIDMEFLARVDGDLRLNCWILEDGLLSNQANSYNGVSGHPLEGAGDPIIDYVNNHVMRQTLTPVWGEEGLIPNSAAAGTSILKTYTLTLPEDYDANEVSIVATVNEHNTKITGRSILNAQIKKLLNSPNSTNNLANTMDLEVFPNPFTESIKVSYELEAASTVELEIVTVDGQIIHQKNMAGQYGKNEISWNLKDVPAGIYFLNIKTKQGTISKKLIRQ